TYLEKLLGQRMTDDTLDRPKTHLVVRKAKAHHFTKLVATHTMDTAGALTVQSGIDKPADAHHAYATRLIAHEHVIVAVDAHDDDAVIAQFLDVEIVLADAGAKSRDEGADFRG